MTLRILLIGEIHAEENEGGAEEKPDGNLLVEQPPGKEYGGDGIEVDPVRSDHRTKFTNDPVPSEVAEHRGNDTQEKEVEEN